MTNNPPRSRPKAIPPSEQVENAELLQLGEFKGVETLTVSEAALVVNAVLAKRGKDRNAVQHNPVQQSTLEYFDAFARFENRESIEAVERLLSSRQELSKFERAQLGSLCCTDVDEAKTVIPSLADKITDEDLQELLIEIGKLMR
ncbi:hypothetical protein QQS21_012556 [Conoideocrella luteorostrata]|uniref:RNA polymerase Rpb4/RPC9 core domain-containing protein n=1 Tax=Conoideocrella luteorostrata TaxID=1105319 RepID=A0AAJ0FM89_9HYPO|nr:hypothetical protein QQS21_012556 [Conoideocrella luteorostrata]